MSRMLLKSETLHSVKLTGSGRRLRCASAKFLVGLVNLAILLSLAPLASCEAEIEGEIAEAVGVDWISLPETSRSQARSLAALRSPCRLGQDSGRQRPASMPMARTVARAAGHRLANGLLAPMQC